jgi:hypothetical protein
MVNPVPNTVVFQLILDCEDVRPPHGDQLSDFLALTTYRGEHKIGSFLDFLQHYAMTIRVLVADCLNIVYKSHLSDYSVSVL